MVRALERASLWITDDEYGAFMQEQRHIGEDLKGRVLKDALGETFPALSSEGLFGVAHEGIFVRVPFGLAFGKGLATHLGALVGMSVPALGDIAALFNLGISLIDRLVDGQPAGLIELTQWLTPRVLEQLMSGADPESAGDPAGSDEVRIVRRIVVASLRGVAAHARRHPKYRAFTTTILEAFNAEMATARREGRETSRTSEVEASRSKSILPFVVIGQLVSLSNDRLPAESEAKLAALSRTIGSFFWRFDDLADLSKDLAAGDVNGLCPSPAQVQDGLSALLEGRDIEQHVDAAINDLQTVLSIASDATSDIASQFHTFMVANARSWMG
jgi:hypothetical protein